jgi:hypothetical protein
MIVKKITINSCSVCPKNTYRLDSEEHVCGVLYKKVEGNSSWIRKLTYPDGENSIPLECPLKFKIKNTYDK